MNWFKKNLELVQDFFIFKKLMHVHLTKYGSLKSTQLMSFSTPINRKLTNQ